MIAFYGGGFDPVHKGHLRAAQAVLDLFPLAEINFLLTALPTHKKLSERGIVHRWNMLSAALEPQAQMFADNSEIENPNVPSLSFNTLTQVRAKIGVAKPLLWLMGSDQLAVLDQWYKGLELLSLAHLIVFSRPDQVPLTTDMQSYVDLHETQNKDTLALEACGRIFFIPTPMLDISSTAIRNSLSQQQSVKQLLPKSVWSYIMDKQIYQPGDVE